MSMIALYRRARVIAKSGEAGLSLTELLVAMVLSTILGAITVGLYINVESATATQTDRAVGTAKARNVVQSWTNYLSVSDSPTAGAGVNRFEWFTPTSTAFYADLFNRTQASPGTIVPPTLIWLRLDSSGQLVQEEFSPIPTSFPASASKCVVLTSGVTAPALFSAFDGNGAPLSSLATTGGLGTAETAGSGCQQLPSQLPSQAGHPVQTVVTNLQTVASVTIDFTVSDSLKSHPLEFNAVTTLPVLSGAS